MGFLSDIVAETARSIRDPAYFSGVGPARIPSGPSFRRAVERDRARGALIVEYKRVSPGSDRPELPARSVAEFARAIGPAGPTAYSCLAAVPRFRGRPGDVTELRQATDRPILFKEFVIDPIQLEAARRAGASAVLLIARLGLPGPRPPVPVRELAKAAHERGLEVLLEFHERAELKLAEDVEADMYGVNVRDLDTLQLERATAEETLRAARGLRPLLGLSGVEGPAEAQRFWDLGADGIVVGSAVARSSDPVAFLRSLGREGLEAGR